MNPTRRPDHWDWLLYLALAVVLVMTWLRL